MLHSKKLRLLAAYLTIWLLGTAILNTFPPAQAYATATGQTASPTGTTAGITVEGAKAVGQTSGQIGQAQTAQPKSTKPRPTQFRHRPGVVSQPSTGPIPAAQTNTPTQPSRLVKPLDLSGFPSLAYSFPGNTTSQDDISNIQYQSIPPDTMGAAGPSQFLMAINGLLRVFTKATGLPEQPFGDNDPDLDTFFSAVMTPANINYATFPRVRYDRYSSRWFVLVNDVPGGQAQQANRILLAVSDGPVISSGTTWRFFYFQPGDGTFFPQYAGAFADNPSLGIDANALYIGVNLYTTSSNPFFQNSAVFVVRKSSVLGEGPLVVTGFTGLFGASGGLFTPVGVDNLDGSVSEGYFIGLFQNNSLTAANQLQLVQVTNPGGTPTFSASLTVPVSAVRQPLPIPHKGGGNGTRNKLDPIDDSLTNAVIHNGRVWAAHTVGADSSGNSNSNNSLNDRDAIHWYEITLPTGQPPTGQTLRQSGAVYDGSTSSKSYWVPSLTVSGQGHTVIGFNSAGPNDYISAAFEGRVESDTLNILRSPVFYQSSVVPYTPDNNQGDPQFGRRWGDYSFTSLDPEDNMTFWTIQEYAYNSDGYGIQTARINAPPPVTPTTASPNLPPGQSSVSLILTGTSSNGSAFYEPGPAFSKHLNVAIDGGISVNGISAVTATSITLNVSTVFATTGPHAVTVINPDGQSVTAAGIINVTDFSCAQTVNTGADSGDGSLRQALANVHDNLNCNVIILNTTDKITLTAPLDELPAGVVITTNKNCSAGRVEIDGSGSNGAPVAGDGLVLNGGYFSGVYVHGFAGKQIVAKSGESQLKCVSALGNTP